MEQQLNFTICAQTVSSGVYKFLSCSVVFCLAVIFSPFSFLETGKPGDIIIVVLTETKCNQTASLTSDIFISCF